MSAEHRRIERLAEVLVHENPWWRVFFDEVRFPNGAEGRHLRLETTTQRPGAVAVVSATIAGDEHLALVRQWRYAQHDELWEFPRGFADPADPDAAYTAARETAEELGVSALTAEPLGTTCADSSIVAGTVAVYLVTSEIDDTAHATPARLDDQPGPDGEVSAIRWVRLAELLDLAASGAIRDGFTLAALGLLLAHRSRGAGSV